MSIDESFRFIPYYSEEEVFETTGQARAVRQLEPSNFDGPMAEWADYRTRLYGDLILSRHVFVEKQDKKDHRVAWIYHQTFSEDYGYTEQHHRILCDCVVDAEKEDEPEIIFRCPSLKTVLMKRAWIVSQKYRLNEVFDSHSANAWDEDQYRESIEAMIGAKTVAYLLEYDYYHPEGWVGNIVSGSHQVSLLSLITQKSPGQVRIFSRMLEDKGVIAFDGETLRLTEAPNEL